MKIIHDNILKQELDKITPLEHATYELTDNIASRIDEIMKRKRITKARLAKMTGHRPCEVSKWLAGGHNFTCRTIALISQALETDIIKVTGLRSL